MQAEHLFALCAAICAACFTAHSFAAPADGGGITVKASSWEQKEHGGWGDFPPELTLDGKTEPASSWRAEGHGQWIEYDLGRVFPLTQIDIGFLKGNQRMYTFEVLCRAASEDEWHTLLKRQSSSGKSSGIEAFGFETVKARFVRIVGYGNTHEKSGKWISITEVIFIAE